MPCTFACTLVYVRSNKVPDQAYLNLAVLQPFPSRNRFDADVLGITL